MYTFYRPHDRVSFDNADPNTGEILPSMTKQSFVAECDINNIVKQFSQTGMLTHVRENAAMGQYLDLPDEIDFQSALNTVELGHRAFDSLPSKIRDRFGNDPLQFLAFLADDSNRDEAISLGLINAPPPAPAAATVADATSPPSTEEAPKTS